jgi:hypothetical protein
MTYSIAVAPASHLMNAFSIGRTSTHAHVARGA